LPEQFPEDVRRFLDDYVESIDQLEILRLLWERPEVDCSVADLSAEIQAEPADVAAHLTALRARGLLVSSDPGSGLVYRFGPRSLELEALLRATLQHYRERPVSMIKLVVARSKDPLRKFADAFRVRPPREGE
jgi:DNA-binding transcriptional ArsR family regulator